MKFSFLLSFLRGSLPLGITAGITAILFASSTLVSVASVPGTSAPRKILTGWIPYYSTKSALASVADNVDLIREVMPFWYTLKSESRITDLYTPANPNIPMATTLTTLRNAGVAILPTITDGTNDLVLANLLADPITRAKVVKTITTLVMANNFDGIDLDFEGFAFSDGVASWAATSPNWVAFIQALSLSLHGQGKLLSVTTPVLFDPATNKRGYWIFDWASIGPMIDRLRIMTYDYSTSSAGPIGPITWVEQSVKYAVKMMPASKVSIGVAGYGRDWVTKVVGICPSAYAKAITPKAGAAVFLMRDAAGLAASYGATATYNDKSAEVNFTYQKTYSGTTSGGLATTCTATRVAWYQDSRSYAARSQLVAKYRLGGITAWTLGMEDSSAMDAVRQVAQSIAPDRVLAAASSDQKSLPYGAVVNVTGQFLLPDKVQIAGLAVRLQMRLSGAADWQDLATGITGIEGKVLIPVMLSQGVAFRFASDASWERLASESAPIEIKVKRRISLSAPTFAAVGAPILISGMVQPHEAGVGITLEKFDQGVWRAIGAPVLSDLTGAFTISTLESTRGLIRYRLRSAADANLQEGVTPVFTLIIY